MATLALFTLSHEQARTRAIIAINAAPAGCRVRIDEPARSLDQNALLWPLLTDIARQKQHAGEHRTPEEWKGLMLHALGKEVRFLPALDGKGFVPLGMKSSTLSKREFSDLLEFIFAWGAENGVVFSTKENAA